MAMEVILMQDVANLGQAGEVVTVADGYARNFLLRRNIGAPVTEAAKRRLGKLQQEREAVRAESRAESLAGAQGIADQLESASVTISVKVAEGEKLYGSVTAVDILESLTAQGISIENDQLQLENPIKELGVYDIPVLINPDVEVSVKVWVVEE